MVAGDCHVLLNSWQFIFLQNNIIFREGCVLCQFSPSSFFLRFRCLLLNIAVSDLIACPIQDPKRLAHKPVKANLRLEVERLAGDEIEPDTLSECGSFSNSSIDGEGRELSLGRHSRHASSSNFSKGAFNGRPKWSSMDKRRLAHSASANSFEFGRPQVHLNNCALMLCHAQIFCSFDQFKYDTCCILHLLLMYLILSNLFLGYKSLLIVVYDMMQGYSCTFFVLKILI